ncbi:hypothetical protein [Mesorhizobium sp.]|nr:hypothetical protein [Mesorhizobium sp.]
MQTEADIWFDLETGGTFMGYWAENNVAVVTAMIQPAPKHLTSEAAFSLIKAGNRRKLQSTTNVRAGWTHISGTGTPTRMPFQTA